MSEPTTVLGIRVTTEERAAISEAAQESGESVSAWAKTVLLVATNRVVGQPASGTSRQRESKRRVNRDDPEGHRFAAPSRTSGRKPPPKARASQPAESKCSHPTRRVFKGQCQACGEYLGDKGRR